MRDDSSARTGDAPALLVLRFGCAWFIFVWAVNKILAPRQYQQLAKWFDKAGLSMTEVYLIAAVQIAVCVFVFAGWARVVVFGTDPYCPKRLDSGQTISNAIDPKLPSSDSPKR